MKYTGMIVTGTSGSGKTTLIRQFLQNNNAFQKVIAVTTREQREDDLSGDYQNISPDEFAELDRAGLLLIKTRYRSQSYGILKREFDSIISANKFPILVITPDSIRQLSSTNLEFMSFFIDADDDVLNRRLSSRGTRLAASIQEQRLKDRGFEESCLYSISHYNTDRACELIHFLWDYQGIGGILPEKIIKLMMECGNLILGGNETKVSTATYDLSLGDEYFYNGKPEMLTDTNEFISIEPHEYVLVRAAEKINLPKDISGRFDIRVSLFLRGLIQSNGPQIDPGFSGVLWCLLFNTSGDTIQIKRGDHYSSIEFSKLIVPSNGYTGLHQDQDRIMQYLPAHPSRSPIKLLQDEIKALKQERFWTKLFPTIIAAIIGIAALTMAILSYNKAP